ncbi:hypothetical protein [Streptomyces sp. 900105755]
MGEVLGVVDEAGVHDVFEEAVDDLAALARRMDEHGFQRGREVGAGVLHRRLVELAERTDGRVRTQVTIVADPLQLLALGEVDQFELLRRVQQCPLQGEHDGNRFGLRTACARSTSATRSFAWLSPSSWRIWALAVRSAQTAVHVRTIAPRAEPET